MFKRLKEYLKKQRKKRQNNLAAYWNYESDEEFEYDWDEESDEDADNWDEESGEDEDDVYGDYGGYKSYEERHTCRWEDGCGGCPYYSDCGIVNDCYL